MTGWVWCISLETKTADKIVKLYIDNIYLKVGGQQHIFLNIKTVYLLKSSELGIRQVSSLTGMDIFKKSQFP